MRHVADPNSDLGPLFELAERPRPNIQKLYFEGPIESDELGRVRRLRGQIADVFDAIDDGEWRTVPQIAEMTGHPENSVASQLRHLRKPDFGSFVVEKKFLGAGLYVYRLAFRPDGSPARAGDV